MTVAAVILASSPAAALADAAGRPAVRRIAETAWAGGAMPLLVVSADPDASVSEALAGSEAVLVAPASAVQGTAGHVVRGMRAAAELVAGTDAALLWPSRFTWVDPETVTMLLQAHGMDPGDCLRPHWQGTPGWPVLVPLAYLDLIAAPGPERPPDALIDALAHSGAVVRALELGDPGAILDRETPIDDLPAWLGPSEPLRPPPDWGAAAADTPDEAPVGGVRTVAPRGED